MAPPRKRITVTLIVLGAAGVAAAVVAAALDPPTLSASHILPLVIFAAAGFLAGVFQIRVTAESVVSLCTITFIGATLTFGPVIGAWSAAVVDFFITLTDRGRVKKGLAAPAPTEIAPARLMLNTGYNAFVFLAAGYAYEAVAGAAPLVAITARTALGLLAFVAALEAASFAFNLTTRAILHLRGVTAFIKATPTATLFDIPLIAPAVALALLASHGLLWGLTGAAASVVLASALLHQQNRLNLVVNRYVTAAKSSEILANPYELTRTQKRDISVLFADLRGTTGISQTLPPDEMLALLNAFHVGMIDEVAKAGATVDKLLGDGLMVLVGAPLVVDDHAARAVQLAVAMQRRHRAIRAAWAARGAPAPGMGIGIASGEVVIGNVGSALRLDYTAIGGEVNVASKLCAAAAADEILVSRECASRVREAMAAGRAAAGEAVTFEDMPLVAVTRMARRLEPVKVIYA